TSPVPGDGRGGGGLGGNRGAETERQLKAAEDKLKAETDPAEKARLADDVKRLKDQKDTNDQAGRAVKGPDRNNYPTSKLGVDLAVQSNNLRTQERLSLTANRVANGRQVLEVGGVWIDEAFKPDMPTVVVKAQSDAYFRILEKYPAMKDVFRLGNHVVWVS